MKFISSLLSALSESQRAIEPTPYMDRKFLVGALKLMVYERRSAKIQPDDALAILNILGEDAGIGGTSRYDFRYADGKKLLISKEQTA